MRRRQDCEGEVASLRSHNVIIGDGEMIAFSEDKVQIDVHERHKHISQMSCIVSKASIVLRNEVVGEVSIRLSDIGDILFSQFRNEPCLEGVEDAFDSPFRSGIRRNLLWGTSPTPSQSTREKETTSAGASSHSLVFH